MINPFSWIAQAPNDQSIYYLYRIFGSFNGLLCNPASCKSSISSITANTLSVMFQAFNGIVLAVGALIVVYVTILGVLKTAHEGEFMGRQWNTLWVPLRVVLGIGLLVPTASGFSGIQIIMMWVITQGIGAADYMWNTALIATQTFSGVSNTLNVPSADLDTKLGNLFQNISCQEAARIANNVTPFPSDKIKSYFCAQNPTDSFCGMSDNDLYVTKFNGNPEKIEFGPGLGGSCGTLNLCNLAASCPTGAATSIKCAACTQQINSVKQIVQILYPVAASLAKADYEYRVFYYGNVPASSSKWPWIYSFCKDKGIDNCLHKSGDASFPEVDDTNSNQDPSKDAIDMYWKYYPDLNPKLSVDGASTDFINVGKNEYIQLLQTAVQDILNQIQAAAPKGSRPALSEDGWIFAGVYYFSLAQQSKDTLKDAMPVLQAGTMDIQKSLMRNFRNNNSAAQILITLAQGAKADANLPASMSKVTISTGAVSSALSDIAREFRDLGQWGVEQKENPLAAIARIGTTMIVVAQILFTIFLFTTIGLTILGNLSVFVLGTGVSNPLGPSLSTTYFLLVPLLFGVLTWLITMGGLLGIYIPLIPYMIFTIGALGWLISVIEAMVAGPLVALGVLSPSGHHEVLGKAEPALMLLFNIFLRPTLMIFGMMAAMVLAPVAVTMVNMGYWRVVNLVIPGWWFPLNVVEIVLIISAYVLFILTVLNKVFAVIHIIPERVMRWISGQGEQYGEAEGLGEQKRGVESASGTAAGAVGAARGAEGVGEKAHAIEKAKEEKYGKTPGAAKITGDKEE